MMFGYLPCLFSRQLEKTVQRFVSTFSDLSANTYSYLVFLYHALLNNLIKLDIL